MPRKSLKISDSDSPSPTTTEKTKRVRKATEPVNVNSTSQSEEADLMTAVFRPRASKAKAEPAPVIEAGSNETAGDASLAAAFRKPNRKPSGPRNATAPIAKPIEVSAEDGDGEVAPIFRARLRKSAPPVVLAEPAESSTADPETDGLAATFRNRPGKSKPARKPEEAKPKGQKVIEEISEPAAPAAPLEFEPFDEDGLAIAWRGKSVAPSKKRRAFEPAPKADTEESANMEPVVEVPAAPPVPVREPIAIPSDAPQVVLRDGIPTLVRRHRVYPPLMLFGRAVDAKRTEIVLDEVRMAAEAGVHLHVFPIELTVEKGSAAAAISQANHLIAEVAKVDADAQVICAVEFVTPTHWGTHYPDAKFHRTNGSLAEPSVCDDAYWSVAEAELAEFVRNLSTGESSAHFMGVHLENREWHLSEADGYDTSTAATRKFRQWTKTRYNGDVVAIRASWFDGHIDFNSVEVPRFQPEGADGERFVRASRKQRRYVDYHLFLSDETVARIRDLAFAAKEASNGYCLVGVSYGYTFEWSHPHSGHLALGKLLRAEEVDYIAGPPSYRNREPGGTGSFPVPLDSFALNNKLYISLEDYRTSLGEIPDPDLPENPILRTPQALESVHWRGAGAALSHGAGTMWQDANGSGWLRTPSVWNRAAQLQRALIMRMEARRSDPEIAVFIDERSLAYLVDPNAFQLLVQNVRESVLRAGASVGFYLLSDLAHREVFPESKLYLFLNAWDIRPELRTAIKTRLQKDGKLLFWLYTAGMFESGRESLERAREVTGIALKPQPFYCKSGTTLVDRRHPLVAAFPESTLNGNAQLEPSYFAIPEDAQVLGEYTQTGLPSFVVRKFDDAEGRWTSVFLGEPVVNPSLIRALAQLAGAHVWGFHDDVVHVEGPFLTVHCTGNGVRSLALPEKYSAYDLIGETWAAIDSGQLRINAVDGTSHVFLVGPKTEIEHLLKANATELLHIADIPERVANVRHDKENFDVAVMKLGEWMIGAEPEESVDEWFLRPTELEDLPPAEPAVSQGVGHRRRRRGRQGDRNGGDRRASEFHTPEPSNPDQVVNVMFRKRD